MVLQYTFLLYKNDIYLKYFRCILPQTIFCYVLPVDDNEFDQGAV